MVFKTNEFTLIKTFNVFMNESGNLLSSLDYLVHDDLDIKLGKYKIQKGKGPKVHNGVESVENKLKLKIFGESELELTIGLPN